MKSIISAAAFVAILSTPALANKMPVKQPANTCQNDKLEWIIAYHLDQIEMAIQEMRSEVISVPPYPKPKDSFKKAG